MVHSLAPLYKKILIVLVSLLMPAALLYGSQDVTPDMDVMLKSAESVFKSMQARQYAQIWQQLTLKSRQTIVADTFKAIKANQGNATRERIEQGFIAGDELGKTYWDSFLKNFDPALILDQSVWEIELAKKDKARIKVIFRKSKRPAILKMFKEEGVWKIGLTESFWANKPRKY